MENPNRRVPSPGRGGFSLDPYWVEYDLKGNLYMKELDPSTKLPPPPPMYWVAASLMVETRLASPALN